MKKIEMYCVTNKKISYLEKIPYNLAAVGNSSFTEEYIRCDRDNNIYHKEKNYSELTFHYWYWKNKLKITKSEWIGFCQKRRFWIKPDSINLEINSKNLSDHLLTDITSEINDFESIICKPIKISGAKKIKIIKRAWRNLITDPLILFDKNRENISLHFDMHHGYKNLDKASDLLNDDDKKDFKKYIKDRDYFNPHIMFISKPYVADKWFNTLFPWLERCENEFGLDKLTGYDFTRLYAYLAERYLSFWFKKYTKYKEHPWITLEN